MQKNYGKNERSYYRGSRNSTDNSRMESSSGVRSTRDWENDYGRYSDHEDQRYSRGGYDRDDGRNYRSSSYNDRDRETRSHRNQKQGQGRFEQTRPYSERLHGEPQYNRQTQEDWSSPSFDRSQRDSYSSFARQTQADYSPYSSSGSENYSTYNRNDGDFGYYGYNDHTGSRPSQYGTEINYPAHRNASSQSPLERSFSDDNYGSTQRWNSTGTSFSRRGSSVSPGQYSGKGPKGYKRTDDRIKEDVCDALTHDSYIDASNIEISVSNGVVTLRGTVDEKSMKRSAEDCAENVYGVDDVKNEIKVSRVSSDSEVSVNSTDRKNKNSTAASSRMSQ